MWVMDYPENVVKDKLRDGLKRDLRKEWAKVRPKLDSVVEQMAMIRDLGHADEDFDREEADRSRDSDRQSGRRDRDRHRNESPGRRREGRRSDNSRPDKRFSPVVRAAAVESHCRASNTIQG
jgi:hypothetical protein